MADVANNDVFNDFEKWEDSVFWPALSKIFGGGEDEGGDNEGLRWRLPLLFGPPTLVKRLNKLLF